MLFQAYKVLNDLNNLAVNGNPMSFEVRKRLFENVYLKKKAVKSSDIRKELKSYYGVDAVLTPRNRDDEEKTESIVKSSLSAWIDLEKVLGEGFYKDKALFEKGEQVIAIITAFEDRATREEELRNLLGEDGAKAAAKLSFKDYSPLSRKLLDGLKTLVENKETGELIEYSILDLMWLKGLNFMEVYESEENGYDFKEQVRKLNDEFLREQGEGANPLKELIDDAYVSPGMKRSLFQAMAIVKELLHILHIDHFDKVFVECARSKAKKPKETTSRKKDIDGHIKAAMKAAKITSDEAKSLLASLEARSEEELRSKHLFHYFMQLGRDVYTGEVIDLNRLSKDYDIDHIIPQAYLKDDSFANTVLVSRAKNNTKSKEYPLPDGFVTKKGKEWIDTLEYLHLMKKEKAGRILRKEGLKPEEIIGFVNRQLVYTNQAVKATIDILKLIYPKTDVIYSKANLVSSFRGMFKLPKVRDLNDFHHANDAYLNIVVGDVYNQKFNSHAMWKWIEETKASGGSYKAGPEWIFKHRVFTRDGKRKIWEPSVYVPSEGPDGTQIEVETPAADSTINLVRKTLSWNDPMCTFKRYSLVGKHGYMNKISYVKGLDSTADNYPLKRVPDGIDRTEWMKKYGSYSDMTTPYYSLVRSLGKHGKHIYSLEGIPTIVRGGFPAGQEGECEIEYFREMGLKEPEIVIDRVLLKTIMEIPGPDGEAPVRLAISGRSGKAICCINASEATMDDEHKRYLKSLAKITGSDAPAGKKKSLDVYRGENEFTEEITEGEHSITRGGNCEFLEYFLSSVLKRPSFLKIPELGKAFVKLIDEHSNFSSLPTIDQCLALNTLVKLTMCKSVQNNSLKPFSSNANSSAGIIRVSKTLQPGVRLVRTSVTGFYEKVLFEVPED